MVQAELAFAAASTQLAASVTFGILVELLALAVGTGVGVGLGLRLARTWRPLRPTQTGTAAGEERVKPTPPAAARGPAAPEWAPGEPAGPSATTTIVALFATAVGFALLGFFCGSLSGTLVLVVFTGVSFLENGVGVTLANLVTGLATGLVAGYLVEALGRRWLMLAEELSDPRQRTAIIALAAGVVMGALVSLLDGFNVLGLVLSVAAISIVVVASSLAVQESLKSAPGQTSSNELK